MKTTSNITDPGSNPDSGILGNLGNALGGVADLFTGLNSDFRDSLAQSWGSEPSGIPPISIALDSLYDAMNGNFVLPAGDVFFFEVSGSRELKSASGVCWKCC
jgi:hypothetical protein